jgi:uncharacterized protein with HEPN domain
LRDDSAYLQDILEAIELIEKYTTRGRQAFDGDELIQTWVVHHLQILGEATGKLSEQLRQTHTQVPWAVIKAMRNVLVHFYFGVDLEKVWDAVENHLPVLKAQVAAILGGAGTANE